MKLIKKIAIALELVRCRIKENLALLELILIGAIFIGFMYRLFGLKRHAFKYFSQVHRSTRVNFIRSFVLQFISKNLSIHDKHRSIKTPSNPLSSFVGDRILVLKPKVSSSEKGVMMIMFSEMLPVVPNIFQMKKLLRDYILVFEPSWAGYCTEDILAYSQYQAPVFLLGKHLDDNRFINSLNTNLKCIDLGASDWVDPNIALPYLETEKKFDIVMNANWGEWKRHHILFAAMRRLNRKVRVALIGFKWGNRTRKDIEQLAKYYRVENQITIFEQIPFDSVMKINCQSRLAVLLSLKEGANRAIPEALFCNTPAIVLKKNIGGQVRNIVSQTGILSTDLTLSKDIQFILDNPHKFTPRKWASENISCLVSTDILNARLKEAATIMGEDWTRDIVVRANSPDFTYYDKSLLPEYTKYNASLSRYLK